MTVLQAIFLGLLQGLTEFLPVSSSGHLALAQHFMGLSQAPVSFDVLLHLATLAAVFVVLFSKIKYLAQETIAGLVQLNLKRIPRLFWLLVIGSIPAGILGLLLNDYLEQIFSSVTLLSLGFLVTSILLSIASRMKPGTKSLDEMNWRESVTIGLFQAAAILPSISRSGSTIAGSLFKKFKGEDAFTFSFLLSIPAILGAGALHITDIATIDKSLLAPYVLGFLAAFGSGFVALLLFKKVLINHKLSIFAYYCLFLSLIIFFFVR